MNPQRLVKKSILLPDILWRQLAVASAREQRTVSGLARVILSEAVGHIEIQEDSNGN